MSEPVLWIDAGGTIVSAPYADPRNPPETVAPLPPGDAEALMNDMLLHLGVSEQVQCLHAPPALRRDSKELTQTELRMLADLIAHRGERHFLVTHGTDALAPNAGEVRALLGDTPKTVVFTGAMVPLSMQAKAPGDAEANLRFVFAHIGLLPPGVCVVGTDAASGAVRCFDPDTVEKDRPESIARLRLVLRPR